MKRRIISDIIPLGVFRRLDGETQERLLHYVSVLYYKENGRDRNMREGQMARFVASGWKSYVKEGTRSDPYVMEFGEMFGIAGKIISGLWTDFIPKIAKGIFMAFADRVFNKKLVTRDEPVTETEIE